MSWVLTTDENLRERQHSMTPRQREVYDLVRSGTANKEIASELGISLGTVKFHISSVYRKLGFSKFGRPSGSSARRRRVDLLSPETTSIDG